MQMQKNSILRITALVSVIILIVMAFYFHTPVSLLPQAPVTVDSIKYRDADLEFSDEGMRKIAELLTEASGTRQWGSPGSFSPEERVFHIAVHTGEREAREVFDLYLGEESGVALRTYPNTGRCVRLSKADAETLREALERML